MSGQFFFTLLNPAVAAILAATFFVLWRKRTDHLYLLLLSITFATTGAGFIVNDFIQPFEAPASRISANLLFLISVASACISALLRINARPPYGYFLTLSVLSSMAFCWYLFVVPSTVARIYLINATYLVMAGSTTWQLYRARPRNGMDWFFVGLSLVLTLMAIGRPLAMVNSQLDINASGSLRDSAYWATVQAFTPVLAIAIALAFLIGLAMRLFDELRLEAERDYLTGLLNRRGFHKAVQRALGQDALAAGVIIIDIDDFKRINDTYGHAAGDDVIAKVGGVIARHSQADLASRTGGEEFTLFYANCSRNDLLERADTLRQEVSHAQFEDVPSTFPVTISLGLHCRNPDETIAEMLAAADRALYGAKRAGKDRAVLATLPLRSVDGGRKAS